MINPKQLGKLQSANGLTNDIEIAQADRRN